MIACIAVGCGGFLGAVLRYLLGLIPLEGTRGFPLVTLLINLAGSFAIGVIAEAAGARNTGKGPVALFLKVGICGGFTTFSTFALETGDLILNRRGGLAAAYMAASLALCVLGAVLGRLAARRVL